jgi:hypothetical protein
MSLMILASVLVSAVAWSKYLPVHSVWSNKPLAVADHGKWHKPRQSNAAISWKESALHAFVNARAQLETGDVYEFQLLSPSSTSVDLVQGKWDVVRNGLVICASCEGSAYGLNGGLGDYFKIYVQGETYHFSGYITNRYDY